jgi:hypothetical protein
MSFMKFVSDLRYVSSSMLICILMGVGATTYPVQAQGSTRIPGRLMLTIAPAYTASVKVISDGHDLYEGTSIGARLALNRGSNQIFLGFRYATSQANYDGIPDPKFVDYDSSLGLRRFLVGQRAYLEISGHAVHSKIGSRSGLGYGGSVGGGVKLLVLGRFSLGTTTLYTFISGPDSGVTRRQLNQSLDLSFFF